MLFTVETYDATGSAFADGVVQWSFGDGGQATGRKVQHTFMYAGEYVTTVSLTRGPVFDTHTISVSAVPLSAHLYVNTEEQWVAIANVSEYMLDVSNWRLMAHGRYFSMPDGTRIASESEVKFPAAITRLTLVDSENDVRLVYPDGTTALVGERRATSTQTSTTTDSVNTHGTSSTTVTRSHVGEASIIGESVTLPETKTKLTPPTTSNATATAAVLVAAENGESQTTGVATYLYVGSVVALVVVIGVLLFVTPRKMVVDGFEVIDKDGHKV